MRKALATLILALLASAGAMSGEEFLRLVKTGDVTAVHDALQSDQRLVWYADEYGQTALMYAIEHAPHLVPTLLLAGADPNHVTAANWTPLAYAIRADRPDLVSALLWAGADPWRYRPATEVIWRQMAEHPDDEVTGLLQHHLVRPREPQPGALGWTYVSDVAERRCRAETHVVQDVDLLTPLHPDMVFTYVTGELPPGVAQAEGVRRVAGSLGASEVAVVETPEAVAATWPTGQAIYTAAAFRGSTVYCLYVHQAPRVLHAVLDEPLERAQTE
ncbi:MAG TPA: ankyrin repeat domain-containing protein [Trueperaceae bacterium]